MFTTVVSGPKGLPLEKHGKLAHGTCHTLAPGAPDQAGRAHQMLKAQLRPCPEVSPFGQSRRGSLFPAQASEHVLRVPQSSLNCTSEPGVSARRLPGALPGLGFSLATFI